MRIVIFKINWIGIKLFDAFFCISMRSFRKTQDYFEPLTSLWLYDLNNKSSHLGVSFSLRSSVVIGCSPGTHAPHCPVLWPGEAVLGSITVEPLGKSSHQTPLKTFSLWYVSCCKRSITVRWGPNNDCFAVHLFVVGEGVNNLMGQLIRYIIPHSRKVSGQLPCDYTITNQVHLLPYKA